LQGFVGDAEAKDKAKLPAPSAVLSSLQFRIVSVWRKTDQDTDSDEFEHEIWMHNPGEKPPENPLIRNTIKFGKNLFFRVQAIINKKDPWTESGLVRVRGRTRRVGTENWDEQEFVFPVTITHVGKDSADQK
jgi:hypothetical protein